MKEGNRLNEPVIKVTALNESLGHVCPISAANESILPCFVIKKRWKWIKRFNFCAGKARSMQRDENSERLQNPGPNMAQRMSNPRSCYIRDCGP